MCGILGLLAPGTSPKLNAALDLLAHRGPDDGGVYADADVFLGARRLSIIDVAGGHQPLATSSGRSGPCRTAKSTTTRPCAPSWRAAGPCFQDPQRHRGHSARVRGLGRGRASRGCAASLPLRVWDSPRRRLLLARDRFGVKPLYYAGLPGGGAGLCVGDSATAGLAARWAARQPGGATGAVHGGLCALRPHTAFDGVCKLPAAHTLVVEGGQVRIERYWDLPTPECQR